MLGIRLLFLRKVSSGDLEEVKLPEILADISSMRHDFLADGEQIDAYLFGHAFHVDLILGEVRLELIHVMQQGWEYNHGAVCELKQRVEVCDDVGALSCRDVHYSVELL